MDLYNREILGYAVSQSLGCEIVNEAMGNAIARSGGLENTVFHSDRGIQYNSESFKKHLKENRIIQSMSRGGCPYDNACSESFFATLKKECVYLKKYTNTEEVKKDIFEYIGIVDRRPKIKKGCAYNLTCSTVLKSTQSSIVIVKESIIMVILIKIGSKDY